MSNPDMIRVLVGGDFCPIRRIGKILRASSPVSIVKSIKPIFSNSDFSLLNLECPLTNANDPIFKFGPKLKAEPETISLLKYLNVSAVTLANNHIRDYGDRGVKDSLDLCLSSGIRTVGAGLNINEARKPLLVGIKGKSFAFINVAEQEFGNATTERAGANPFDLLDTLEDIWRLRTTCEKIIVIVHGGLERTHYPSPRSVKVLRFIAEQGVSAVLRHHAHFIQGYEVWKGVPIFYGLGNVLDDSIYDDVDWNTGLMVELQYFSNGDQRFDLHPVCQDRGHAYSVNVPDNETRQLLFEMLIRYNECFKEGGILHHEWKKILREREVEYRKLMFLSKFMARILSKLGLLDLLGPSALRRNTLLNLMRCDTHREICIDILQKTSNDI